MTTATTHHTARTDENGRFLGDRYERLRSGVEMIASDQGVANAGPVMSGEALRVFVGDLVERRVLDGLTERDANTVAMLTKLDFPRGQTQMAGRIVAWLNGDRLSREDDNTLAVCAVLAEVLALYLGAFADPGFKESRAGRWTSRR